MGVPRCDENPIDEVGTGQVVAAEKRVNTSLDASLNSDSVEVEPYSMLFLQRGITGKVHSLRLAYIEVRAHLLTRG